MIRHSYRRDTGHPDAWRRYDVSDIAGARLDDLEGSPGSLSSAAVAAMTDATGIEVVADVSFELESNRLQRDTVAVAAFSDGVATTSPDGLPSLIASGRYSPAVRHAIADTESARLDDGGLTYGTADTVSGMTVSDKAATTFETSSGSGSLIRGRETALNGDAAFANPAAGTRGRWSAGVYPTESVTPTRVAVDGFGYMSPTYVGPDGVTRTYPWSYAWRLVAPAGQTLYSANYRYLWANVANPTRYVIPPAGTRRILVVANVVCQNGSLQSRLGAAFTLSNGSTVTMFGAVQAVPQAVGPTAPTRIVGVFDVPGPVGGTITSVRPIVDLATAASPADRAEVTGVQVYAGDTIRPNATGIQTAAPSNRLEVRERFYSDTGATTPKARRVNRVDIAGELRASRITAASVEVELAANVWTYAGHGEGSGRISVELSDTYDALGVRVTIEETTSREDGPVYVSEIDPRYVVDVTDDVVELELEWARETAPGTATSPVGNYEASTLSLTLDDTDGRWNPARNASLDVGHRIDVATGVRYRNVAVNPDLDVNLDGWGVGFGNETLTRVLRGSGLEYDAPRYAAAKITAAGAGLAASLLFDRLPVEVGERRRSGVWVKVEGDPGSFVELWATSTPDGTTLTNVAGGGHPRAYVEDGWTWLQIDTTIASGSGVVLQLLATPVNPLTKPVSVTATGVRTVLFDDGDTRQVERTFEELVPAGVFYSEPYETDSESTTVTIEAIDKVTRQQDAAVDEPVRVGQTVGRIVRDLALRFLDFDEDQVAVDPDSATYAIPYAYGPGRLGAYLADLAKATSGTLHIDPLERLAVAPRGQVSDDVVAEVRADNALISFKRPPAYDVTASVVTVNASPLKANPVGQLWSLPDGGITLPAGGGSQATASLTTIVAPYDSSPALNAYVHGLAHNGGLVGGSQAVAVAAAWFYSDRAFLTLSNAKASTVSVSALLISGTPLVETPLSAVRRHEPSVRRYGERELAVDARLIQTQSQVDAVAEVLLDSFRGVDDAGIRRLPDLSFAGLGLLHVTAGDRVILHDPERHVGSEYAVLSRRLVYADGALLLDDVRVRESVLDVTFAIVDESATDSGDVAGY